jgi:hypothetical protein
MTTGEAESLPGFSSLKELYLSVADEDSASYEAFIQKFHRAADGNPATLRRMTRQIRGKTGRVRDGRSQDFQFVAYDGEGWDDKYVLLANSLGEHIIADEGERLTTRECLEFLTGRYDFNVKRVFFSFGYDVNHILRDLDDEKLGMLLRGWIVEYEGFRIHYIPGKMLIVNNYKFYDVFSFFQKSFIKVVESQLGKEHVTPTLIEGKAGRGSFDKWDPDAILAYNAEELDLMVRVMDRLRDSFDRIDTRLTDWYGPGAVAKHWFTKHGIAPSERMSPGAVIALNSAYYGGRFEQPVLGRIRNVWEYDLHSAYPSAMSGMPYFRSWHRSKTRKFTGNESEYSIWHISFDLREDQRQLQMNDKSVRPKDFMPLPVRDRDGRICYPMVGRGWYWFPEIKVMLDNFPLAEIKIHDGYVASTEGRPFAWVRELYDHRAELKSRGDGTEFAIKVGLNSLYGKCAQRVGNNKFFSLSWAGYITALTRARIARAGYQAGNGHVLGFATDAVFTDAPVPGLDIGPGLGQWEESRFVEATFFQVGVYRTVRTRDDGSMVTEDRYRGSAMRRGIDDIIKQLREHPDEYPRVKRTLFVSHGMALQSPQIHGPRRLTFAQNEVVLKIDAPYKRHYHGFTTGYRHTENGMPVEIHNFRRLLTRRIDSEPKVCAEDNQWVFSRERLFGSLPLGNVESQPHPIKDANTQRLIEDAEQVAAEEGYDEFEAAEPLPIISEVGMMD